MKAVVAVLAVAFLPALAAAKDRSYSYTKKVDLPQLEAKLRAAGFKVKYSTCRGLDCTTYFDPAEKKDPAPIVAAYQWVDPEASKQALVTEMASLETKIDGGTITQEETRRLLKLMLQRLGWSRSAR